MKRCPECRRDYYDDTLLYCLEDGKALVQGSVPSPDEPATAILSVPPAVAGGFTQPTDETEAKTAILQPSAIAGGSDLSEKPSNSSKSAAKPLIAAVAAVAVLVGGFFSYRYFNPALSEQINSIAVLPFQNVGGNPDSEYLSDGLAETLVYRLSQLPDLKVSPASSVIRYKGKEFDAQKIAGELGVKAVLFGKVTPRGDSLSISVELIDAVNNRSLWGEQYERKMADLLATQREIAATITQKLQLKLSGEAERKLAKTYTTNDAAYQIYLKGRFHFAKRTPDDVLKSIGYYQQAAKLAPDFALAYVGLAEAFAIASFNGALPRDESISKAVSAARQALSVDPGLAEAHSALGFALWDFGFGNWSEAEAAFKRSIEIDPNVANSHYYYSLLLQTLGRTEEGLREMERAVELEPLSLILNANLAGAYFNLRQFEKAAIQVRKATDLDPNFPPTQYFVCLVAAATGKYDEILTDTYIRNHKVLDIVGYAYAKTGREKEARNVIQTLRESKQFSEAAFVNVGLGDIENAFADLDKAIQVRAVGAASLKVDPLWDPLRDDPRYRNLLRRMNMPE